MTELKEVRDAFLGKITDYDMINITEEELEEELMLRLSSAMAKYMLNVNVKFDKELKVFNCDLEPIWIEILAIGLVSEWISPKIHTLSLIKQAMQSKDWTQTSQANHLKQLQSLQTDLKQEANYWSNRVGILEGNKKRRKKNDQ